MSERDDEDLAIEQLPTATSEARAECDDPERTPDRRTREHIELREQFTSSEWVTATLGERPEKPYQREAWERAIRAVTSYHARYDITDTQDPLGPRPEQREQRRDWQSAQRAIERAQRRLHRTPADQVDLGIGL